MEDLETSSQINSHTSFDEFSLIDVSASDDDFLLASSSEPNMAGNPGNNVKEVATTQLAESLDLPKPRKAGKCNLRKSLAWDSAFFTNDGVLDPDELSSIIKGTETGVKQNLFLPGIQEEISKSTDSTSSLQSDNLMLESLEADLFSDIRASIQKCSKSSTTGNSRDNGIHGEDESKRDCSRKIVEPSSRKLMKPKSVPNKFYSGVQGSMKSVTKPPVNRSRDPTLVSRQLKAAARPSSAATTKRLPEDGGRAKQEVKAAGNVKGKKASSSEAVHLVDSRKPLIKAPISKISTTYSAPTRKPLAKPSVVPKVSAASTVLKNKTSHSARSSCDSSSSSVSENVQKSQTGVIRRKSDKTVNLPSVPKHKTFSKVAEKVKSQNNGSRLSAYVKSTENLSSSISPASSISEWSVESFSSTATLNQKHFGLSRCSASSLDVPVDSNACGNLQYPSTDSALGVFDDQVPGNHAQSVKQLSAESAVSNRTNSHTGFAKPSGLRLPSPNIGFFDGAKGGAKTPSSSLRSRSALPTTIPRSVAGSISSSGAKIKTKLSASKMTTAPAGTVKPKQEVTDASLETTVPLPDHSPDVKNPSGVKHIDNNAETLDSMRIIPPNPIVEKSEHVSEVVQTCS